MSECPPAGEGAWRGPPNGHREERNSRDLSDLSTDATGNGELGGVGRGPGLPEPRPSHYPSLKPRFLWGPAPKPRPAGFPSAQVEADLVRGSHGSLGRSGEDGGGPRGLRRLDPVDRSAGTSAGGLLLPLRLGSALGGCPDSPRCRLRRPQPCRFGLKEWSCSGALFPEPEAGDTPRARARRTRGT